MQKVFLFLKTKTYDLDDSKDNHPVILAKTETKPIQNWIFTSPLWSRLRRFYCIYNLKQILDPRTSFWFLKRPCHCTGFSWISSFFFLIYINLKEIYGNMKLLILWWLFKKSTMFTIKIYWCISLETQFIIKH